MCIRDSRSWLVHAHQVLSTPKIFSHLMNKARPIIGADVDAASSSKGRRKDASGDDEELSGAPRAKRPSASTKRKSALTRVITKNNRQRRQGLAGK